MSNPSNPVVKALASAQQETWNQNEAAIERTILEFLHPVFPPAQADEEGVKPVISAFAAWCEMMNVRSCPARPAVLAGFIVDLSASMPAADLVQAAADIADWHLLFGLANPAATPIVLAALDEIATVEPPRSWPKEQKHRFRALPHDLQVYIAKREKERDLALRRAQNTAAGSKRKRTDVPAHEATDITASTASTETV
ncbi:hypothetical protein V1291_000290 [Nitrobacteraceae bacterium AZCC 1564]